MLKARLVGMLASVALLAGAAACDSPTAAGRDLAPNGSGPRLNGFDGGAQEDTATAAPDTTGLVWPEPTEGGPVVTTGSSGTVISVTPEVGDPYVFAPPAGSTVTTYTETIGGITYTHIVVVLPDGTIVHFIYDPSRGITKIYVRYATQQEQQQHQGSSGSGAG